MNYFKNILFFFLLAFNTFGQENLILNGDFEEYWTCPDDMTQIEKCKYVYNPCEATPSTSDFYHGCYIPSGGSPVGVPVTTNGFQYPKSGDGMVGFVMLDGFNNFHYREYLQLQFSESIGCDNIYEVKAYFNLSSLYRYSIKNIGFYFSENEIDTNDYLYNLFTPQYTDITTLIDDTLGWVEVAFEFKADKEYNYLTIGHFLNDSIGSYIEVNPTATSQTYSTYLYLDDVSLIKKYAGKSQFPNVFTPNNDGINDVFKPLDDSEGIEKIIIINRWGNVIRELSAPFEWDGLSNTQKKMDDGVYFYKVFLKENCNEEKKEQYHGMVHLIR